MSGDDDFIQTDEQVVARKLRLPAGDTRPAPSVWEQTTAGFRTARDDVRGHFDEERMEAYAPVLQALRERGFRGDRIWGYKNPTGVGDRFNFKQIQADVEAARRKDPSAFAEIKNWNEWEKQWQADMRKRQARDNGTVEQSGFVPWLAGSAAGAMTDPLNAWSMTVTGGGTLAWSIAKNVLVNGAVEIAQQPTANDERRKQGRPELTTQERLTGIGVAMAGGAALDVGGRIAGNAVGAVANRIDPIDRQMGRALAGAELDKASPADIIARFDASVPEHVRTPEQQAARNVFERAAEIDEASPFARTHDATAAHQQRVDEALARLVQGATGPARPRAASGIESYLAAARRQESSGNANARNPKSSASGLYQFTDGTWLATYKSVFPGSGLSDAAILGRKGNVDLQERLMRRFTEANGQWLQRSGFNADPGNLYVVHHLGQGGANAVLRAAPDMPIERLLTADVIKANPHMRGMTAGEFRQWAAERMRRHGASGGGGEVSAARAMPDEDPAMRAMDEADMMAERLIVRADGESIDPGMIDGMDAPAPAAPLLLRDLFPDDASWRMAQARVDAEAMGMDAPDVTWRDVLPDDAMQAQARQLSDARAVAERDMNAVIEQGRALTPEAARSTEGLAIMQAADLAQAKWRLARYDELEAARAGLESDADRASGFSMSATSAYRYAANDMGFHPLTREEIAAERAYFQSKVESGGRADPAALDPVARMKDGPSGGGGETLGDAAMPQGVRTAAGGDADIYADPASPDMALQADRLWHDLENDLEADVRAYHLNDGDQRTIAQVKEEFSAETAAINAVRGCL